MPILSTRQILTREVWDEREAVAYTFGVTVWGNVTITRDGDEYLVELINIVSDAPHVIDDVSGLTADERGWIGDALADLLRREEARHATR